MKKDGVCSLVGAGLAVGILVGSTLYEYEDESLWWFDATVATALSVGLFFAGALSLWKNAGENNKWWTVLFWKTPVVRRKSAVPHMEPTTTQWTELNAPLQGADSNLLDGFSGKKTKVGPRQYELKVVDNGDYICDEEHIQSKLVGAGGQSDDGQRDMPPSDHRFLEVLSTASSTEK
jgi:hypothetical protein